LLVYVRVWDGLPIFCFGGEEGFNDRSRFIAGGFRKLLYPWELGIADRGYRGLPKEYDVLLVPMRKSRQGRELPLTPYQEQYDRELESIRVIAEHAIERIKIMKGLSLHVWPFPKSEHKIAVYAAVNIATAELRLFPVHRKPSATLLKHVFKK